MSSLEQAFSCFSDYDPNALTVGSAREFILDLVAPLDGHERAFIKQG